MLELYSTRALIPNWPLPTPFNPPPSARHSWTRSRRPTTSRRPCSRSSPPLVRAGLNGAGPAGLQPLPLSTSLHAHTPLASCKPMAAWPAASDCVLMPSTTMLHALATPSCPSSLPPTCAITTRVQGRAQEQWGGAQQQHQLQRQPVAGGGCGAGRRSVGGRRIGARLVWESSALNELLCHVDAVVHAQVGCCGARVWVSAPGGAPHSFL